MAFAGPGSPSRSAFARDGVRQRAGLAAARRDPREDDRRILEASARYRARLANFIRRRVPDQAEAEDILQEVFYELAAEAGITVNAMVLRKHHAVLYLRRRLRTIRNEFLGE